MSDSLAPWAVPLTQAESPAIRTTSGVRRSTSSPEGSRLPAMTTVSTVSTVTTTIPPSTRVNDAAR